MMTAQTSVKAVINHYFRTIGGLDLINQVDTFYAISQTNINGNNLIIKNKQQKPNLKSVAIYKDGTLISKKAFNGKTGYQKIKGIKKAYTPSQILEHRNNSAVFPEFYYLKKASYLGKKEVLSNKCHVLAVGKKRIFYDVASGLKLKSTNVKYINQIQKTQETYYLNYKEVKGIKFPTIYKTLINRKEITYRVRSISLNKEVSAADFE